MKSRSFFIMTGVALIVLCLFWGKSQLHAENSKLTPVIVDRVVDGDTIVVKSDVFGQSETVRMIGVNTPESVSLDESENCSEGEEASDFTKSQLKKGNIVYLEHDVEVQDQYGRTLAYIWLRDDCDLSVWEDFCKYNYGAVLLQNTYCESVYYEPNGKYREWYDVLEKQYQELGQQQGGSVTP